MERYEEDSHINIGAGEDMSIRELADLVRAIVYPEASLTFDASKPDGMQRKLLDVQRLERMGWKPKIPLRAGIESTYQWFLANYSRLRGTA
jgi:GDP-L-fucose synthase